jgi:hypothetical protein
MYPCLLLLLPLIGAALAADENICVVAVNGAKGGTWQNNGELSTNDPNPHLLRSGIYKMGDREIVREKMQGMTHPSAYTYSFFAGAGKDRGSEGYIDVKRTKGKGLGQQFRISFRAKSDPSRALGSFLAYPNKRCTFKSPFRAEEVHSISVWSRE